MSDTSVQAGMLLVGSRPVMKLTERLVEVPFGKDHIALIEKLNDEINRQIDDGLRRTRCRLISPHRPE